ncbi:hypothetical protein BJV78DRAFT_1158807 [Lactifluus subvellereus]|nr:hypothetical protein BJV78DRAFT_1158807 [Lactifluus subvellereus]
MKKACAMKGLQPISAFFQSAAKKIQVNAPATDTAPTYPATHDDTNDMIVDLVTPPPSPPLMAMPAVTVTPMAQVEPLSIALGDMVDSHTEELAVMTRLHSPASVDCQPVPVPTSSSSPDDMTESHTSNTAIDSDVPEPNIVPEELGDTEGDLVSEPATMAQFKSQHSKLESLICHAFGQKQKDAIANAPPQMQAAMRTYLMRTGMLPENNRGRGASHETLLNRADVLSGLRLFITRVIPVNDGGFEGHMRPAKLVRYVNQFLLPTLGIELEISESTAVQWLKKLGFKLCRVQKGIYVDGHEHEDVIKARKELIDYLEKDCPSVWQKEGEQPLCGKGCGRITHISDYIIEHCGQLCLSPEEIKVQMSLPNEPLPPTESVPPDPVIPIPETSTTSNLSLPPTAPKKTQAKKTKPAPGCRTLSKPKGWVPPPPTPFTSYRISSFDAHRIIYQGANHDPWWDMPQLIAQTEDAIKIFNVKYPNGIAVFIFDCSSAHEAYAEDALLAHKMNRGLGGQQPLMHDTVNPLTGETQTMVYPTDSTDVDSKGASLAGKAKGMEQVLRERGILDKMINNAQAKNGKVVSICKDCTQSQAARDKVRKEAKARQDEIEGSGVPALADRIIYH